MNGEVRSLQSAVAEELVRIGREGYEWRRRAGLTQRAVEALTGIDQTTICKFERGRLPGLRLHHLARIRLACKTGKRVESTYGRRQPTRPLMTPDSSQAAVDVRARTENGFDRDGVSRGRGRQGQPPGQALLRDRARGAALPRDEPQDAIEVALDGRSIGRARRAPRRR